MSAPHTIHTDRDVLNWMHLRDHEGMTAAEIADRFSLSRNSIIGALHRVKTDTDKHQCECKKPENRDGGMKPLWWR